MSQGGPPDWDRFARQPDPFRSQPDPSGFGPPTGFDPVTGQALPPGPAAYSAVDPYAAAGYPPPTLAQPAFGPPAGYQPPFGGPGGYPLSPAYGVPPGYQLVPIYPMPPPRPLRPGGAVAAAVLGYVQSGFVLIGSIALFTGAAGFQAVGTRISGELTTVAVIALIAGALLIAGATTLLNRKPALLTVGASLSIAISIYFVIRLSDFVLDVAVWVPILYAVLPILMIALSAGTQVRAWVRARTFDAG